MGDLLPCPFCGAGLAAFIGNAGFSGVEVLSHYGRYWVNCGTCGGQGPSEVNEATAIAAWNRRAPLDEPGPVDPGREGGMALTDLMDFIRWARDAPSLHQVQQRAHKLLEKKDG